ncbi:MAG: nuclear transport factor 2 family protein [Burkholderiaceae bacterium]
MPNPKARATAPMTSPEDAEAQFYEALRDADLDRVMAVWAEDEDVVCVHPGGTRVIGPAAVRATFEAILANGPIVVHPEHVKRVQSMGGAVHSVLERIDIATDAGRRTGWIVATNVYVKTAQGWRMVAHHASAGAADELHDLGETPAVLH